jgi:hypothetical protein
MLVEWGRLSLPVLFGLGRFRLALIRLLPFGGLLQVLERFILGFLYIAASIGCGDFLIGWAICGC